MIRRGQEGEYRWIETRLPQSAVGDIIVRLHAGCRLAVVSFDSTPIRPGVQEQEAGWQLVGQAMVSPALHAGIDVPEAGYDEWYLLDALPLEAWMPELFVNYLSFTLAPVSELAATQPQRRWDWLIPLQKRFWDQVATIRPVTYVAASDWSVIVVSRRRDLIETFEAAAPERW